LVLYISDKFAVGRTVLAFQHTLDLWNEAEIRALLPDNQFTVFFPDTNVECQIKLSEIKLKQKSVRLADIMGADFKGSQSFTDFVINGVRTSCDISAVLFVLSYSLHRSPYRVVLHSMAR
jgi:hypothetical protein